MKAEIKRLLAELANSNRSLGSRSKTSRDIRRQLRRLGHYGGLRNAN